MGGCGRLAGIATIEAHRANVAPLWRRLLAGFGAYWRDRFKAVVDCSADMTRLSRRGRWVSAMLARIDFAQGFNWSGQRRWRRWRPGTEPGRWRGRKRPTEGAGSAESLWLSEGSDAAIDQFQRTFAVEGREELLLTVATRIFSQLGDLLRARGDRGRH